MAHVQNSINEPDLLTFRGVAFDWRFHVWKVYKVNEKNFWMYFKSKFIKPNKYYIIIFINNLIKNSQKIAFFDGPK